MRRPGCYLLLLPLPEGFSGEVGSLGALRLEPGTYGYVGSALGGLDQRLSRHLRREKAIRWHVDRLSVVAEGAWALEFLPPRTECSLAAELEGLGAERAAPGFGCSDCRCQTHLFRILPGALRDISSRADGVFPPDRGPAGSRL